MKGTKWFFLMLLVALTSINIFLLFYIQKWHKPKTYQTKMSQSLSQDTTRAVDLTYYNSLCPEIELITIDGKKISLRDLIGHVIIIKFARLTHQDAPDLIYLDHLYNKHRAQDLNLFFILRKNEKAIPSLALDLSAPMVEDDGFVHAIFNAKSGDALLIGRDFRIKLKSDDILNEQLFPVVNRFLIEGPHDYQEKPETDIENMDILLNHILYKEIETGRIRLLKEEIKDDKCIVYLSISNCFTCPESYRIKSLQEIVEKRNLQKGQVIILYGKGNDIGLISQFTKENDLNKYFTVGIILDLEKPYENQYWNIFRLDVDPRLVLLDRSEIVFEEDKRGYFDLSFLEKYF
jgi:hypothetical protein